MTKSTPPPSPLTNSATSTPRRSARNVTKVVRDKSNKKKKGSKRKGSKKKGSSTGNELSNDDTVNKMNEIEKRKFVDGKGRSIIKKRPKHHTDSSRRATRTMSGKKKSMSSDEEYTSSSEDNDLSDNEEPEEEARMDIVESDKHGGRGDEGSRTFSRRRFLDALNREEDDIVSDEARASTTSNRHTALRNEASLPLPSGGNTNVASSLQDMEGVLTIRGMSSKESVQNRQKHIADRLRTFVKSDVFRRVKFINSDLMFQTAFKLAMDHENVPAEQRAKFQMLYESVFNEALNTKRSSCEQSGAKFVREQVKKMGGVENFYTIEELSKLRRATTEREREATFWFFGTYLQCVSGRRAWGKQRYQELVSKATEIGGQAKVVTTSDEAFALLLFDNYIEKWLSEKQPPSETNEPPDPPDDGRKKGSRRKGKYTGKKSGHCKYGGWSREGTARFNHFYNLVQVDRASPLAETMEKQILQYCKAQKYANEGGDDAVQHDEGGTNEGLGVLDSMVPVEAYWDLED
jgi:hypothetical protein